MAFSFLLFSNPKIFSMTLSFHSVILLKHILSIIFFSLLLSSCSVYKIQKTDALDRSARWMMLPLLNHSDTPEAGARAADIVATLLRSRGIKPLSIYTPPVNDKNLPELDQQKILSKAFLLAKKEGQRFAVSGSVQEWRYKSGLDGEPATGITLTITDLMTGKIIWSASGSKTGWGRESVSGTAHKLMAELIDGLDLME